MFYRSSMTFSPLKPPEQQPVHRSGKFLYVIAAIAALGGLLFGYDTGAISGAILYIRDLFSLFATQQGLVVSSVLIGAAIASHEHCDSRKLGSKLHFCADVLEFD